MQVARLLVAALVGAFLITAPGAKANHVQCGDVITQDTTLDSDLFCSGDGIGIFWGEVTLDLNGHVIAGDGGGYGVFPVWEEGVSGPFVVKVVGGTIRGFAQAVPMDGPEQASVDDMVIEANEVGFSCRYIPVCEVEDSTFRSNGEAIDLSVADGSGFASVRRNVVDGNDAGVSIADYTVSVTGNRIEDNRGRGITINYAADAELIGNVIAGNGEHGVVVSFMSDAIVTNNEIVRNGGAGLITDYEVDVHVRENRVWQNAEDGVHLGGPRTNAVIDRNRTDRNGDDGIDIEPCVEDCEFFEVRVSRNRAFFNSDLGIEAAPGTTDGGGNRAKHNGNPAQCVGVRCR